LFRLDIVVIFIVPIVLVVEIGTREVVTEAFVTSCTLVVVAVRVLEVDAASGKHCDFLWYGGDRNVVGNDRSVLKVAVIFCRIDALRDEVLFLVGSREYLCFLDRASANLFSFPAICPITKSNSRI